MEQGRSGLNVVVLVGELVRPASERTFPSGDRLVLYELRVPRPPGRVETVPVIWPDAPAVAGRFNVDDEVLVVGRVRRRLFRAGGGTQSRTEVVADVVILTRQRVRVRTSLARARAELDLAAERA